MSNSERGGGGVMRDGATQTGRAVILIVVAIVVAVVLLHHSSSPKAETASTSTPVVATTTAGGGSSASTGGSSSTTAPASATSTAPPTTVPVADVKVQVLNGDDFNLPLASSFTDKVKAAGYTTLEANNAAGTVKSSVIYVITAGYAPEGDALATSLGLTSASVQTAVPTTAPLYATTKTTGANLVLVVGPDLAAKASTTTATTAG